MNHKSLIIFSLSDMKDFIFYFKMGWSHILSTDASDHLLFIAALTIMYTVADWKKLTILVTAFTTGHALTLFLAATNLVVVDTVLVEFAIPCTILITSLMNLILKGDQDRSQGFSYGLALGFGLVHGLGYANYIRMMLSSDQHMVWGLFSFNVGLEAGQIIVVLLLLFMVWMTSKAGKNAHRYLVRFVSLAVLLFSLLMIIERFPF